MAKVCLITGGAKGIGRAIALELASKGFDLVINYLTSEDQAISLKGEIEKIGRKCLIVKADISKEDEAIDMYYTIESEFGGVDVLINNAAVDFSELFSVQKTSEFRRTLDVNVVGAYIMSKLVYKYMKEKKWGRIINISSTNGLNTYYPTCISYDASKAALNQLTHDLALEFAPYINVNAVAPGFIKTEAELAGYDAEFMKAEEEKIFVGRAGEPEEVAHVISFLVSDEASYINNAIIRVDGGQYGA